MKRRSFITQHRSAAATGQRLIRAGSRRRNDGEARGTPGRACDSRRPFRTIQVRPQDSWATPMAG
jgi:hypothetical protein